MNETITNTLVIFNLILITTSLLAYLIKKCLPTLVIYLVFRKIMNETNTPPTLHEFKIFLNDVFNEKEE